MHTNGDQSTINQRFTVPVAAEMLGISPEAVRARMHRGTLRREKGADGTVYVRLDDNQSRSNGDGAGDRTADQTPDQTPMAEVLREQVAYLREQLDREREARTEERRRQDTIIAQLTQANAALASRIPELESPSAKRNGHEAPRRDSEGPSPRPDTAGAQEGAQEQSANAERSANVERPTEEMARRPWWVRIFVGR